jgi:hypothetical protein
MIKISCLFYTVIIFKNRIYLNTNLSKQGLIRIPFGYNISSSTSRLIKTVTVRAHIGGTWTNSRMTSQVKKVYGCCSSTILPVPFLQPASFLLPRSYPARRKQKRRSRLIWEESKASAQATDSNISFEACAYTRPYWCQLSYPIYSLKNLEL